MTAYDVKRCPFCGSRAEVEGRVYRDWLDRHTAYQHGEDHINMWRVKCTLCDAARVASTESRAVAKWNTRPGDAR